MPVTCWLMFVGCLSLAGFPFITAGFWSKDLILGDALAAGLDHQPILLFVTVLGVITALLTAYYSFRLWFRVFMGDERYTMGHEHHGYPVGEHPLEQPIANPAEHEASLAEAKAVEEQEHAAEDEHHHEPHEMPWLPMNLPLVALAIGALILGYIPYEFGWFKGWIGASTAAPVAHGHADDHHATFMGMDPHNFMILFSSILAIAGIAIAAWFHWLNRSAADSLAKIFSPIVRLLTNKYYIDEIYDALIVQPLRSLGALFYTVDAAILHTVIQFIAFLPGLVGRGIRPAQAGRIQGYGLGMAMGIAVLLLLVLMAVG
jgi:NADH-quinone oxidoreductase subunit L